MLDREDANKILIIAMTANTDDTDVKASLEVGINAHLAKPIDLKELYKVIEEFSVLYDRTYLHIEILILKAIILYRRGEDWKETLMEAVSKASSCSLVRVFSDQGVALLPL